MSKVRGKKGDHIRSVGGIQITNVDLEAQRDSHHEETVCFEDGGDLIAASSKLLADRSHCRKVDNLGGILHTPPPPESLEDDPAQPELFRCG